MILLRSRSTAQHTVIQMPKGALLHIHVSSTVDVRFLLDLAIRQPAIHIRVPKPVTAENIASILPEIEPLTEDLYANDDTSITSSSYIPNTWVNLARARESFDLSLGGPDGFDKWVVGTMMVNPEEAYRTHPTVNKVFLAFSAIYATLNQVFLPKFS